MNLAHSTRKVLALVAAAVAVAYPAAGAHAQPAPTLASAALPLSSLPKGGKLAAQGYVAKASLGSDVRAAYDRVVMFHGAGSIIFFDERLLETESPAAAKADLATLRRSFAPARFAAWDGSIHDLYLASVLLPVDSRVGRVVKLAGGDEAFEVVAPGSSRCCTYETDLVFVRVGRFVAFMIYGHVGDPDPSEAALLSAALDQTATRLAAIEAARPS